MWKKKRLVAGTTDNVLNADDDFMLHDLTAAVVALRREDIEERISLDDVEINRRDDDDKGVNNLDIAVDWKI